MLNYKSKKSFGLIENYGQVYHIIGIGGIGMSAIGGILHENGFKVQGSDLSSNYNIEKLEQIGVKCAIGHAAENIYNADIIVYSNAVKEDNQELLAARTLNKIIKSRWEILREMFQTSYNICVSGMHGKTTITSMIALVVEHAKMQHISLVGGIMEFNSSNYINHKNHEWAVIEADESDDTFIKIPRTISVVSNISPEHLDYHLTFDNIKQKFFKFIDDSLYDGFSVLCIDDKELYEISKKLSKKNIVTYSVKNKNADYFSDNITIKSGYKISFDVYCKGEYLRKFQINMFGKFNVLNSLAALAVAHELKIDTDVIAKALQNFRSTKRRFEIVGKFQNAIIIDDYAHHPKEIDVVIETAKDLAKNYKSRVIGILQPHRYSRYEQLMDTFASCKLLDLDKLIILPIYSAGEKPIEGVSSEILYEKLKENFLKNLKLCHDYNDIKAELTSDLLDNDLILFLGAGDITYLAHKLAKEKYRNSKPYN